MTDYSDSDKINVRKRGRRWKPWHIGDGYVDRGQPYKEHKEEGTFSLKYVHT